MKLTKNTKPAYFSMDAAKLAVEKLIGRNITLTVKERGREVTDEGKILAVHARVFLFEYLRKGSIFKASYTYSDLYTGNVVIKFVKEPIKKSID